MGQEVMRTKLNLGCGDDYMDGWLNVDKFSPKADLKIDLNERPWKLPADTFEKIEMINVLEHLKLMPFETMDELYRVSRDGCMIEIEVPYCHSSSAHSANHVHRGFAFDFFEGVCEQPCDGQKFRGKIIEKVMIPSTFGKLIIPIPFRWGYLKNTRDIASFIFNEVYTHIRVRIRVHKI